MSTKRQLRLAFRTAVFRRDRYRCAMCGKPGKDRQGGNEHRTYHEGVADEKLVPLDAHHITDRTEMPNGGYVKENGISLCADGCHLLAEIHHQTGTAHAGLSPADLYAKIGTSYEEAYSASLKLA